MRLCGALEVQVESTGQVFVVPRGETIASVLQAADVAVSLSCEQGICGACLTCVVSGRVDHRDEVLSCDERDAHRQVADLLIEIADVTPRSRIAMPVSDDLR